MAIELSIVVPMYNEAGNVARLAHEIAGALASGTFELLLVDDGSTDETLAEALRLRPAIVELRVLRLEVRLGQSAAIWAGVRAARAPWVVTLDGDCQNDPRDIPELIRARSAARDAAVRLVVGHRIARRDTSWKRMQSRIANAVRGRLLGDRVPDTGCGLKLFARDTFLSLPRFDHMHRFLPALFLREGARVVCVPVRHRPRVAGRSKYAMLERLAAGIVDLVGVLWLARRAWPKDAARELTAACEFRVAEAGALGPPGAVAAMATMGVGSPMDVVSAAGAPGRSSASAERAL